MTTLELLATLGVVADWALFFGFMHPTKIPIFLGVGAATSTLLDTQTDGVSRSARES